jgi:hypothetical protein
VASSADGSRNAAVSVNGVGDYYGAGRLMISTTASTTLGTAGGIVGKQFQAIELQYIGGGSFIVLGAAGTGFDVR